MNADIFDGDEERVNEHFRMLDWVVLDVAASLPPETTAGVPVGKFEILSELLPVMVFDCSERHLPE